MITQFCTSYLCFTSSDSLPVYNCAAGKKFTLTLKQMLDIGISAVCKETAMEHMVWKAGGGVTLCKPYNFIRLFYTQIIPSIILDFGLKLRNENPKSVCSEFESFKL